MLISNIFKQIYIALFKCKIKYLKNIAVVDMIIIIIIIIIIYQN